MGQGEFQDSVSGRERLEPDSGHRQRLQLRLFQANGLAAGLTLAWIARSAASGNPPNDVARAMLAFFMAGLICLSLILVVRTFGQGWLLRADQLADTAGTLQLRSPVLVRVLGVLAMFCFAGGLLMGLSALVDGL